jgi:glutathione peroxidase
MNMKKLILMVSFGALFFFSKCARTQERPATLPASANGAEKTSAFYNFKLKTLDGKEFDFATLKGKKVLIVNTASKCGYTPQYAGLEKLYHAYKGKNVEILGIPANNFMAQEPGNNGEIKEFCTKNYGVTFTMFEKMDVKGDTKAPLYKWLSSKSKNGWNNDEPSWNFCKYLINEKGELVAFFPSKVEPTDKQITDKLN